MTAEEIVRAEIAAWGRNDVDEVMSRFAADATFDIGPARPQLAGRDAIHEIRRGLRYAGYLHIVDPRSELSRQSDRTTCFARQSISIPDVRVD